MVPSYNYGPFYIYLKINIKIVWNTERILKHIMTSLNIIDCQEKSEKWLTVCWKVIKVISFGIPDTQQYIIKSPLTVFWCMSLANWPETHTTFE